MNATTRLVSIAIEEKNKQFLNIKNSIRSGLKRMDFYKENATIQINLGRRSGHTTAAVDCALSYFSKPLFINYNKDHCSYLTKQFINRKLNFEPVQCIPIWLSINTAEFANSLAGISGIDAVIIDNASYFSPEQIHLIYAKTADICIDNCIFLLLG